MHTSYRHLRDIVVALLGEHREDARLLNIYIYGCIYMHTSYRHLCDIVVALLGEHREDARLLYISG